MGTSTVNVENLSVIVLGSFSSSSSPLTSAPCRKKSKKKKEKNERGREFTFEHFSPNDLFILRNLSISVLFFSFHLVWAVLFSRISCHQSIDNYELDFFSWGSTMKHQWANTFFSNSHSGVKKQLFCVEIILRATLPFCFNAGKENFPDTCPISNDTSRTLGSSPRQVTTMTDEKEWDKVHWAGTEDWRRFVQALMISFDLSKRTKHRSVKLTED